MFPSLHRHVIARSNLPRLRNPPLTQLPETEALNLAQQLDKSSGALLQQRYVKFAVQKS